MIQGDVPFVSAVGMKSGVQSKAIENVVELRSQSQRPSALDRSGGVEMLDGAGCVGNLEGGTVEGQQPESVPCAKRKILFKESHESLIQFDQSRIMKFLSRSSEGAFSYRPKGEREVVDSLKESIQLGLERAFEEVQQEKDQGGESQTSFPDKMLGSGFVALEKFRGVKNFFEVNEQVGTFFLGDFRASLCGSGRNIFHKKPPEREHSDYTDYNLSIALPNSSIKVMQPFFLKSMTLELEGGCFL